MKDKIWNILLWLSLCLICGCEKNTTSFSISEAQKMNKYVCGYDLYVMPDTLLKVKECWGESVNPLKGKKTDTGIQYEICFTLGNSSPLNDNNIFKRWQTDPKDSLLSGGISVTCLNEPKACMFMLTTTQYSLPDSLSLKMYRKEDVAMKEIGTLLFVKKLH